MTSPLIVNDVTQLNPVEVASMAAPTTVEEIQSLVRNGTGPISIGGGRFSMGGQTASPGSLHLDLRRFNRVVDFSPLRKTIRVQTGIRWCDIQKVVDPHGLAVKVMQTYANFTVGGALSVNAHGRYIGWGPVISSVRSVRLVLADGSLAEASPTENPELFYGAIGCYGALGILVEAELELVDNVRVERASATMPVGDYAAYFRERIGSSRDVVFHNADLYPPHYSRVRAVTWSETDKPATTETRLQSPKRSYPVELYFLWAISETPLGKWRREHVIDRLVYTGRKVHWRNYEAGYDVAELEPPSRKRTTYVLQEYFVPVDRLDAFVPKMAEIFRRYGANVLNVSIRHAQGDPGSLLAWARGETFAFVVYYKQRTSPAVRDRVALWTRELIEAALSVGGTYYLPYQPHATPAQFHRAYPRAKELFALKRRLDPDFRFRNALWDRYYAPTLQPETPSTPMPFSEFHAVYDTVESRDAFFRFLQNIYRIYPEDRFHALIGEACALHADDASIYRRIQEKLPSIKPFLADLTYALPALRKQKREMARQTLELLGDRRAFDGYLEIGSTGRYIGELRKHIAVTGPLVLVNDVAPTNSPADILERGRLAKLGTFVPLDHYAPIPHAAVADASIDLVTCYIGLHHVDPQVLDGFIRSVWRVLRPGGLFVMRDHDVRTLEMKTFVSLVHTVFNVGLHIDWKTNEEDHRFLLSADAWAKRLAAFGFRDSGKRLLQANDPSDNTLMLFAKPVEAS